MFWVKLEHGLPYCYGCEIWKLIQFKTCQVVYDLWSNEDWTTILCIKCPIFSKRGGNAERNKVFHEYINVQISVINKKALWIHILIIWDKILINLRSQNLNMGTKPHKYWYSLRYGLMFVGHIKTDWSKHAIITRGRFYMTNTYW